MNPKFTMTHGAAILAALCALLALISGALATTASTLSQPFSTGLISAAGHTRAGEAAGALMIALLVWVAIKEPAVRGLASSLCLMTIFLGFAGSQAILPGPSRLLGLSHAILAQVLMAGTVAVVLATAPAWKRAPEYVGDYGWPSLRSLAALLPVLVLTQVFLGAAFRQRVSGLMAHIVGAILVSLVIIIVCAFTLQQCPAHAALRASAKTLMAATFAQVFLGIAAFTVRVLPDADANAVLTFTGGHVTVGALVLSASVVLSMQIRRNVLPKGTTTRPQAPSSQSSGPRPPD